MASNNITGIHAGFVLVDKMAMVDKTKSAKIPCTTYLEWYYDENADVYDSKLKFRFCKFVNNFTGSIDCFINCRNIYYLLDVSREDGIKLGYIDITAKYTNRDLIMAPLLLLEKDNLRPMAFYKAMDKDSPWFYLTFRNIGNNKYTIEIVKSFAPGFTPENNDCNDTDDDLFMVDDDVVLLMESYYLMCEIHDIRPDIRCSQLVSIDTSEQLISYDEIADNTSKNYTMIGTILFDDKYDSSRIIRNSYLPYCNKRGTIQKYKM